MLLFKLLAFLMGVSLGYGAYLYFSGVSLAGPLEELVSCFAWVGGAIRSTAKRIWTKVASFRSLVAYGSPETARQGLDPHPSCTYEDEGDEEKASSASSSGSNDEDAPQSQEASPSWARPGRFPHPLSETSSAPPPQKAAVHSDDESYMGGQGYIAARPRPPPPQPPPPPPLPPPPQPLPHQQQAHEHSDDESSMGGGNLYSLGRVPQATPFTTTKHPVYPRPAPTHIPSFATDASDKQQWQLLQQEIESLDATLQMDFPEQALAAMREKRKQLSQQLMLLERTMLESTVRSLEASMKLDLPEVALKPMQMKHKMLSDRLQQCLMASSGHPSFSTAEPPAAVAPPQSMPRSAPSASRAPVEEISASKPSGSGELPGPGEEVVAKTEIAEARMPPRRVGKHIGRSSDVRDETSGTRIARRSLKAKHLAEMDDNMARSCGDKASQGDRCHLDPASKAQLEMDREENVYTEDDGQFSFAGIAAAKINRQKDVSMSC